jgi:branched-chain amino acid aminotransferase
MELPLLDPTAVWAATARRRDSYLANYYAMFSSVYGGIVTDPRMMLVPLDDHMVHRGDGVFEALKCVAGNLYNFQGHWERLEKSAAGLELKLPVNRDRLLAVACETIKAGGRPDCMIRIYISRGSGGFSVNPYECPRAHWYVVVTALGQPFMAAHPQGARIGSSMIPVKAPFLVMMKNCNYVPNVLMKKEAVDRGFDFVVGFDDRDLLTESATENVGIVTPEGSLRFPRPGTIMLGTTMLRVMALAEAVVRAGDLRDARFVDIPRAEVQRAAEILLTGTTLNVAAVVDYDGQRVGDGKPGPIWRRLSELLDADIRSNAAVQTPVFQARSAGTC